MPVKTVAHHITSRAVGVKIAVLREDHYWLERTGQNIRHDCKPIYEGRDRILIGGAGDYWEDELKIENTRGLLCMH